MANYIEDFNSKLDWAMPFQRTGKFPLDRSSMFDSYEDAVKYAAGAKDASGNPADSRGIAGTSYIGQLIVVFENDVVTVYKINADRKIEALTSESGVDADILELTTNLNAEIAARKAVDGQTGQTYTKNTGATHISAATSLNDADIKLNNAITAETKARQDAINALDKTISKTNDNFDISITQTDGLFNTLTISDIHLTSGYTSVKYPEVDSTTFTSAKASDTLDVAIKTVDQNVATLVQEVLNNEEVVAAAITEIKESIGVDENLKYVKDSSATFISEATTFSEADSLLDIALANEIANRQSAIDALDSTVTSSTTNVGVTVVQTNGKLESVTLTQTDIASAAALTAEIAARKAVDGQTGQTYAKNTSAKHISAATSLNDADIKLNNAITAETKARQDAIDALDATYTQSISVDSNGKATSNHIGFELSQLNGKITGFSVTELDIASAYDLSQEIANRKAAIEALDSTKSGATTHVGVKVVETNGKLESVTVTESDIASAAALTAEIAARKAVDGQSGQTYTANTSAKHISAATSLNDADIKLNNAITAETKARQDAINALDSTVTSSTTNVGVTVVQTNGKLESVTLTQTDIASAAALTAEIAARKAVDGQTGQTYAKNTSTAYIKSATSLNDADIKLDAAISNLKMASATTTELASLGENVREAYKLIDSNSTQHGDWIKIYKDSSLKTVTFSNQQLHFTYVLANGTEKTVDVDVSAFLTENEYGDGLKVVDHVISAKLGEDTTSNKNFLDLEGTESGKKSLAVRSMDTDVTYTTDRIIIAGGPLDSTNLRNILPKDDSGNAYIEKGTDIQSLLLSLFTKIEWPTPSVTEGKISTSIAQPSFTLTSSGSDVEVGTNLTLSEATLSTATNATTARTCGKFTYGYSTSSTTLTNKGTKTVSISASNIGFNSDNYTMTRTFTGFTNTSGSATPSTTASNVKITSATCRVVEGTNSVKVAVTGPKGVCTFAAMPQYYIASNIYSLSADKMSPSKAQATITATTAPSNSKTLTVTGKYKYFMGYSTNTLYSQFNSASVRALTTKSGWVTKDGTTTIVDNSGNNNLKSNGTSIVIACPSKYKLASIANGVGANILSNFTSIGEVDVTTGAITTKYKVYVYPITNGAQVEFKNVTLTKA